jgi:hypothetical protein
MTNQEIAVVYKWTANPGKAEGLKAIYREVENRCRKQSQMHLK